MTDSKFQRFFFRMIHVFSGIRVLHFNLPGSKMTQKHNLQPPHIQYFKPSNWHYFRSKKRPVRLGRLQSTKKTHHFKRKNTLCQNYCIKNCVNQICPRSGACIFRRLVWHLIWGQMPPEILNNRSCCADSTHPEFLQNPARLPA